jgi:hypothetical protein
MRIEYEPTFEDYKAANVACRMKTPASAAVNFILFKLLPLAAVVSSVFVFVQLLQKRNIDLLIYNLPPVLIAFTVVMFWDRYSCIRRQVRNLFPVGVTDKRIIFEISEENIVSSLPNTRRTEYSWGSISLFLCSPQVNLLYISSESFILIPNRVLTAEEKASLHEIIARKGIKRKPC